MPTLTLESCSRPRGKSGKQSYLKKKKTYLGMDLRENKLNLDIMRNFLAAQEDCGERVLSVWAWL